MLHFWMFACNIDESITFFLHIICHDFSSISIYLNQFDFGVLCLLYVYYSDCSLMQKAIFNQSQSFCTKLRTHATSHSLPNRPTVMPAQSDHGQATDHQRAWRAEKSVRDVNKNMSERKSNQKILNSEVKELSFCGDNRQSPKNVTVHLLFNKDSNGKHQQAKFLGYLEQNFGLSKLVLEPSRQQRPVLLHTRPIFRHFINLY